MKRLNDSELTTIEGGVPWLVVAGVCILVAGIIDGCNNARYESTAEEACTEEQQPEC